ncbi:DMT family transporter [Clostridium sp.]|uniref:DMT family transporter n=1 Tax=Clostridium sp. TaxID=1506 RepID=UPI0034642B49
MNKKTLYADLSLIIVAIVWGAGFVASKEALNIAKPFYMMTIRFTISTLLMVIVFRKYLKTINKQDLKSGIIVGIFLFLAFGFQTVGLQYTTASKQGFLTAINVVIVPFLYWGISKKRPDMYSIFSAFLCFIGISLLTLQDSITGINLGDALTLLCALFFALHIVSVGYFASKTNPIVLTIIQLGTSAALSSLVAIFTEPMPNNLTLSGTFSLLYLGVFSTLIAFLLQNIAQKHTSSTHAAIILSTECVFGSILSMLILKEIFTFEMFIGSIIIFSSIIISETKLDFLKKNKKDLSS